MPSCKACSAPESVLCGIWKMSQGVRLGQQHQSLFLMVLQDASGAVQTDGESDANGNMLCTT